MKSFEDQFFKGFSTTKSLRLVRVHPVLSILSLIFHLFDDYLEEV